MAHDITYSSEGRNDYRFQCRCGDTCEPQQTRQMAEDKAAKHLDLIDRIRKPRTCTLEVEYRHAKEMAEKPEVSERDRELWRQMATEIGRRLGYEAPPSEEQPLFTL